MQGAQLLQHINGAGANERERGVVGRGGKNAVAKEETPGERTGVGRDGRSGEGLGRTCTAISVELKCYDGAVGAGPDDRVDVAGKKDFSR